MGLTKLVWLLAAIVLVLGIVAFAVKGSMVVMADRTVKGTEYQAVFLTNNQVYFGHLSGLGSSYIKLKDIYYLQVQQTVQPKDASQAAQQQISLAKLGGELHGPEDQMFVARDQVLFWENLKNNGKVAQAIADYVKSQKK